MAVDFGSALSSIRRDFTDDEVTQVVCSLGSPPPKQGANGELMFQTVCHHGDSFKLYWYREGKRFHCYTHCGDSFNLYELVMRSLSVSFGEALRYVNNQLGIADGSHRGFNRTAQQSDDWKLFDRYKPKGRQENFTPEILPAGLIGYYPQAYPQSWLDEGITQKAMDDFFIRFDPIANKIIIPQIGPDGDLVGIRGRALDPEDIAAGKKYMPVTIEGKTLRHPTAYNLYGLYQNREAIIRSKKIMLFEAEKSVMKCHGFYGENDFTVAVCGSSVSNYQRDLILSLGVSEVFLAFDKEYHKAFTSESDVYADKILSIAYKFAPYVTTWVLWDTEDLIGYKDSPADRGQEVLETLMKNKFEVKSREEDE